MNHTINYKRILTLLGVSVTIIIFLLYIALTEYKVEDYRFVGDWKCTQKDVPTPIELKITKSAIYENNKKLYEYYPKTSRIKEDTYSLYDGNNRMARIKELNEDKIRFKKTMNDSKYYCNRNGLKDKK